MGAYWAWIAIVIWAGAASPTSALRVEARSGDDHPEIVPVFCRPGSARGDAATATLAALTNSRVSPSATYVGVVFGGAGPIKPTPIPFSVARGASAADVVRGGKVVVEWTLPDVIFDLADDQASAEEVAAVEAMGRLDAMLGRSPLDAPDVGEEKAPASQLWLDEVPDEWAARASTRDKGADKGAEGGLRTTKGPDLSSDRAENNEIGTAYRIRTGDLRLERAVS